jgi:hypothetical protein
MKRNDEDLAVNEMIFSPPLPVLTTWNFAFFALGGEMGEISGF